MIIKDHNSQHNNIMNENDFLNAKIDNFLFFSTNKQTKLTTK